MGCLAQGHLEEPDIKLATFPPLELLSLFCFFQGPIISGDLPCPTEVYWLIVTHIKAFILTRLKYIEYMNA